MPILYSEPLEIIAIALGITVQTLNVSLKQNKKDVQFTVTNQLLHRFLSCFLFNCSFKILHS